MTKSRAGEMTNGRRNESEGIINNKERRMKNANCKMKKGKKNKKKMTRKAIRIIIRVIL